MVFIINRCDHLRNRQDIFNLYHSVSFDHQIPVENDANDNVWGRGVIYMYIQKGCEMNAGRSHCIG
jgi:hypothetical protein